MQWSQVEVSAYHVGEASPSLRLPWLRACYALVDFHVPVDTSTSGEKRISSVLISTHVFLCNVLISKFQTIGLPLFY